RRTCSWSPCGSFPSVSVSADVPSPPLAIRFTVHRGSFRSFHDRDLPILSNCVVRPLATGSICCLQPCGRCKLPCRTERLSFCRTDARGSALTDQTPGSCRRSIRLVNVQTTARPHGPRCVACGATVDMHCLCCADASAYHRLYIVLVWCRGVGSMLEVIR